LRELLTQWRRSGSFPAGAGLASALYDRDASHRAIPAHAGWRSVAESALGGVRLFPACAGRPSTTTPTTPARSRQPCLRGVCPR
jgi:hypothetical protein